MDNKWQAEASFHSCLEKVSKFIDVACAAYDHGECVRQQAGRIRESGYRRIGLKAACDQAEQLVAHLSAQCLVHHAKPFHVPQDYRRQIGFFGVGI